LTRKTRGFSKEKVWHQYQINLYIAYHHFVKTHKGLRIRWIEGNRKWVYRTPTMAAGITDHVWTLKELLSFKVPKKCSMMVIH